MSRDMVKWIQKNQFIKNKYPSGFIKIKSLTEKENFWAWFLSIQLDSFKVPVSGYQGRDM